MARTIGLLALIVTFCPVKMLVAQAPDPAKLAARIDQHLAETWRAEKIVPAPLCDDAACLRRAVLDLTGRIPRPDDIHRFLADKSEDKRRKLVDRLLADPRFAHHLANVWRAELLPETAAGGGARLFQNGFEAWLRQQFRAGTHYDELVRDLITVPIAQGGKDAEPVLRDPERANPLAF